MHIHTEHTLNRSSGLSIGPQATRAPLTSGGGRARAPSVISRPPHILASLPCASGRMPSPSRLRAQQLRGPHRRLKSVDADRHLPSAAATARSRLLRGTARSTTHADRPAGWSRTDDPPAMRQQPPDGGRHRPQQRDEDEVDEALHDEQLPTDGADVGAVSKHDGHDAPKLLLCETRRTDEHLQVSRAPSSKNVEVSKAHGGKAGRELRQSRGASGSQTFALTCYRLLLRSIFMPCMPSASLLQCETSGTAAVSWASRAHVDTRLALLCVGGSV